MKILEDVLKNDKKLVTTKRGSCDQFLTKLKFSDPDMTRDGWNPSSYVKTRPVLRIDSELEDKTGTMCAKLVTEAKI